MTTNRAGPWLDELGATAKLAWPLIIAQIASILLFTTDVVMMGWLGPSYLAAGTLATSLLHPITLGGLGVVSATGPMIAQAIGARQSKSVRRTVRQGFWVAGIMTLIAIPIILNAEAIFLLLGQVPETAALAQAYLNIALGAVLPGLLIVAVRSLLQGRGDTSVVLWITVIGVFVNAGGNYLLMFGNYGFPRLEMIGAGISTTIVNTVMFLLALAYVLFHKRYRRYHVLVRLWKPDWPRFFELFRIGIPIGLTLMSEVGMFGVAVIMMGWLGVNEVAAHAIALQCAAITFMVPLGLSQATIVRVGLAYGAADPVGVTRAGWTSLGLTTAFMTVTATLFWFAPDILVRIFLDPARPENAESLRLAASYLAVAALFQLVDGAQVSMAGTLRGLSDTRMPMVFALIGYWILGLGVAYLCAFTLGMRGVGIWLGLAAGLAAVAFALTLRFALRDRLGLLNRAMIGVTN